MDRVPALDEPPNKPLGAAALAAATGSATHPQEVPCSSPTP
ncbi:hypothetical protein [Streptomyces sp. NPDC094032]